MLRTYHHFQSETYTLIPLLSSTPMTSTTLDDIAANFTYSPGWDSSPNPFSGSYLNSTMQYARPCRAPLASLTTARVAA
jgi:hypothetical protein